MYQVSTYEKGQLTVWRTLRSKLANLKRSSKLANTGGQSTSNSEYTPTASSATRGASGSGGQCRAEQYEERCREQEQCHEEVAHREEAQAHSRRRAVAGEARCDGRAG